MLLSKSSEFGVRSSEFLVSVFAPNTELSYSKLLY
jgi:hypothetical protein